MKISDFCDFCRFASPARRKGARAGQETQWSPGSGSGSGICLEDCAEIAHNVRFFAGVEGENFKGMDAAESMDRRGRGEKEEGGRKRGEEREGREREKV